MRSVRSSVVSCVAIAVALAFAGMAQAGLLHVNLDPGASWTEPYSGQGAVATPGDIWNAQSTPQDEGSNTDSLGNAVGVDFEIACGGFYDAYYDTAYLHPQAANTLLADYAYSVSSVSVKGLDASKTYDITVYGACPFTGGFESRGSTFTLSEGSASVTELTCTGTFADWTASYVEGVSYVTFHGVTPVSYTYSDNSTVVGFVLAATAAPGSDGAALAGMQVVEQVPEPGTIALLAMCLIGLLCYAWRKRK